MKELFHFLFRCTKLKCGVIGLLWVTSAPEPRRSFLLCWGCFVQLGGARVAVSANWKTCEIQVERFWECSYLYLFYCFTVVLFSLGILQALYFSLILSKCNFFVQIKMLWHCILQPEHVSEAERRDTPLNIPLCGRALRSVAHGQSITLR